MHAGSDAGRLRSESIAFVKTLDLRPVDFEAHEATRGSTAFLLCRQRGAADEMLFFQMHQLAQSNFKRGKFLGLDQRLLAAEVIHFDEN